MIHSNEWRCFHCSELFTTEEGARQHFGVSQMSEPACQIDIAKYREMEARWQQCLEEDSDLHRELHRVQGEHGVALRREEEKGYSRGLMATTAADALTELVACKDLKDEFMRRKQRRAVQFKRDFVEVAEVARLEAEYKRRQPEAWKRAREVLKGHK